MTTKHETTLAYRLDARGLREARQEITKTFKPTSVREMNSALKEVRATIKTVAAEQARLSAAMLGVKKGTDEFKALESQLKDVDKQARALTRTMGHLQQATHSAKTGAFTQGFLQGISPTAGAYLQRDEGMRRQFLGQTAGSAVRGAGARAVGGAASMFQGAGPLSTVFQGIPGIGGVAAMGEGAVGQAVDYQRAQLGAIPFLGGFRGVRRGQTTTTTPSDVAANVFEQIPDPAADARYAKARNEAIARVTRAPSAGRYANAADMEEARVMAAALDEGQRQRTRTRAGLTPIAPKSTTTYTPGTLDAYVAAAGDAFMGRPEAIRAAGEFGQQVGGAPGAGAFGQAQAARVLYGIDQGTSAGLFRGQRAGRGGASALGEDLLASTIEDAMAQGLEGSEIGEHLAQLVALQEQAAAQGLKIQPEALQGMAIALNRAGGLEGARGLAVAGQMQQFGARVAAGGANGPVDIQLLRALGFNGGGDSYIDSLQRAEELKSGGLDADSMFSFLENLGAGRGNPRTTKLPLARALRQAGVNVGLGEAESLARAVGQGREGFAGRLADAGLGRMDGGKLVLTTGAERGGTAATMKAELGSERVQQGFGGLVAKQIAIEEQLLSAGQKVAGNVQDLQKSAANVAAKLGEMSPLVRPLVDGIVDLAEGTKTLIDKINEWGGITPVRPTP